MSEETELKHTPGPWRVEENWDDGCLVSRGIFSETGGLNTGEEYEMFTLADARLIAAAPDLLAACLSILPFLPKTSASEGGAARFSEHIAAADKIRAAISEAMDSEHATD